MGWWGIWEGEGHGHSARFPLRRLVQDGSTPRSKLGSLHEALLQRRAHKILTRQQAALAPGRSSAGGGTAGVGHGAISRGVTTAQRLSGVRRLGKRGCPDLVCWDIVGWVSYVA